MMTFEDFDVEPHSNCSYDYVAMYDGTVNTDTPLLLMHCGRDLMIKSTSNQTVRIFLSIESYVCKNGHMFGLYELLTANKVISLPKQSHNDKNQNI